MNLLPSILAGLFSLIKQYLGYFLGVRAGIKKEKASNALEESKSRAETRKIHDSVRIDGKYRDRVRQYFDK